ncbi:unnamed protein product [Spirodela intermedia]|uniref:Uncharacterized protein n=1 Tax=Spirodela intermedia TaxID=51605 RepID=A0A7I8KJV1_SPIIN|nr:unnamed protein product [Spirodela intermedia]
MDLTAKRRDAAVFLSLVCILLASPAASISTAWPEQATYEKVRSALAEARLRREAAEFWPVDWRRVLAGGLVAIQQAASASTTETAATSTTWPPVHRIRPPPSGPCRR